MHAAEIDIHLDLCHFQSTSSASNTGPSWQQARTVPSAIWTLHVLQAPNPQVIIRSIETWQGICASAAILATPAIMGWGPQVMTTS
jgi:hypothetical protein